MYLLYFTKNIRKIICFLANYRVASGAFTINEDKYSVSKNPSSGQYNRLHILNVRGSDAKKYSCRGVVNGQTKDFFLQLDLLGRNESIHMVKQ
jgi:hypothetical protein